MGGSLHAELATLPAKYGPKAKGPKNTKRKTRVSITEEIVAKVKKLLEDEKTGSEIADAVGISLPSVQNIKKKLGLVKKRK